MRVNRWAKSVRCRHDEGPEPYRLGTTVPGQQCEKDFGHNSPRGWGHRVRSDRGPRSPRRLARRPHDGPEGKNDSGWRKMSPAAMEDLSPFVYDHVTGSCGILRSRVFVRAGRLHEGPSRSLPAQKGLLQVTALMTVRVGLGVGLPAVHLLGRSRRAVLTGNGPLVLVPSPHRPPEPE